MPTEVRIPFVRYKSLDLSGDGRSLYSLYIPEYIAANLAEWVLGFDLTKRPRKHVDNHDSADLVRVPDNDLYSDIFGGDLQCRISEIA